MNKKHFYEPPKSEVVIVKTDYYLQVTSATGSAGHNDAGDDGTLNAKGFDFSEEEEEDNPQGESIW